MTIRIVNQLDEASWGSFVDQHPQGNIFHTPEMFQVFKRTKGYHPELWAALDEEAQPLVLFLPVRIALREGLLAPLTSRTIVFGGLLAQDTPEAENAAAQVIQAYQHNSGRKSLFTEIRNVSPSNGLQRVLQGARFVYEDHLNYLVDLGPTPEAVFSRIGKRTQRNIRHGLNQGHVEIVQVKTKDDLLICYSLLKKTYQNAKVPLAQSSLFEAAFDLLMPQGKCMVTLARVGGKPAAASFELIYKETLFGWYGGMDREFGSYVPNELLMWHILRWGSERSFNCYDFGGAGKPSEQYGVRDFKAKFGGELVCYGRNTWVPYPMVLKIGEFGYQRLRKNL